MIWKNSRFSVYAFCILLDYLGNVVYTVALPMYIFEKTGSALAMSMMAMMETLPHFLGPVVGALVDRLNKRRVLIVTDSLQTLLVIVIPILDALGFFNLYYLYFVGFMLTLLTQFNRYGRFAVMPLLYPDQKLEVNAALTTMRNSSRLLGPLMAGGLLAIFSPSEVIALNAITYIVSVLGVFYIRIPNTVTEKIRSVKQVASDTKNGLGYLFKSPTLISYLVIITLSNLGDGAAIVIMMFHARDVLQLDNHLVGLLMTGTGVGMLLGSLIVPKFKHLKMRQLATIAQTIATLGILVLVFVKSWIAIPLSLFLLYLGGQFMQISRNTIIQTIVSNDMLGRVYASTQTFELISKPIIIGGYGIILSKYNTMVAFSTMAVFAVLTLVYILVNKLDRHYEQEVEMGQKTTTT